MKININNINAERVNSGKVQSQAINLNLKGISNSGSILGTTPQMEQNLSRKRTIVDAIIISQMAGSFLQEAIRISSRLNSIASEAISSGKMKEMELSDALTGIKSSLNDIQEGFAGGPAVYATQNHVPPVNISEGKVELPHIQINEEINSLKKFADDLSSGDINLKKIDRINDSLINKASVLDNTFKQLIDALPVSGGIAKISSADKYPELVQDVVNQIIKNPQVALKAQRNINSEAVKNLL